jgi:hypothetical protein
MKSTSCSRALLIAALSFCTAFSQAAVKANQRPHARNSCSSRYDPLFSKPTLKIRVVFGYKDARPARFVGDRHERLAFVQRLLAPCAGNHACGFERSSDNADLFIKTVRSSGQQETKIYLSVVNSSVGSDDQANRADLFQTWTTRNAQSAFFGGVNDADVVFYNGHSRFGGGPDFGPPRLTEAGTVDAAYYENQKPGIKHLIEAFQNKASKAPNLKVLGLFSCSSSQHFTDEIRRYSNVGLISSRSLVYYTDALENSLSSLSAILDRPCSN